MMTFKPVENKHGAWAIGIFKDGSKHPIAFLNSIDPSNGRTTKVNRPDIGAFTTYTKKECEKICSILQEQYKNGEIS